MSTITIDDTQSCVLVISTFTVHPDHHERLLGLLTTNADTVLRAHDGFLGCSIASSTDQTTIVNYAQWRDADALKAMLADPAVRRHAAHVRELASVQPVRCHVDHVAPGV
jgi:quinol monooxygenase YgiN